MSTAVLAAVLARPGGLRLEQRDAKAGVGEAPRERRAGDSAANDGDVGGNLRRSAGKWTAPPLRRASQNGVPTRRRVVEIGEFVD